MCIYIAGGQRREERREEQILLPPSPRIYKRSGVQRGDI